MREGCKKKEARKAIRLGEEKQEGEKTKIGKGVGESRKKIATFKKEGRVIRPIRERVWEDEKIKKTRMREERQDEDEIK